MRIIRKDNGRYAAVVETAPGVKTEFDTGAANYEEACRIASEAKLKELETHTKAARLNEKVRKSILRQGAMSVSSACDSWLSFRQRTGQCEPTTWYSDKSILEAWMKSTGVSATSLQSVSADTIHRYINDTKEPWKRSTRVVMLSTIRKFLKYCQDEGWTTRNPAGSIKVVCRTLSHKQMEPKIVQTFTDDEITRLVEAATPSWGTMILLSRHSGLRLGDAATLEWDSVTFTEPNSSHPSLLTVWTDKRDKRVQVPLPPQLTQRLRTLLPPTGGKLVFPEFAEIAVDPKRRAGLSVAFKRLCDRVGIKGKSFHGLRHTFISELAKEGKKLEDIAVLVGHSDTATTEGYVHP